MFHTQWNLVDIFTREPGNKTYYAKILTKEVGRIMQNRINEISTFEVCVMKSCFAPRAVALRSEACEGAPSMPVPAVVLYCAWAKRGCGV